MIAAIYARKSTDQNLPDAEKSVTRQIEHATAYATRKGWTVDPAHVYQDDGISGAEFVKRPGFLRLMNALKPKPPIQVLLMSEESRLGREQIETAYALKQIITAGVAVWYYLEDRERTLDSPTDKILLAVSGFADEVERDKARQRTYDAMARKAQAGHVTGGRVYGYDNVPVFAETPGPDGRPRRVCVIRRVNPAGAPHRPALVRGVRGRPRAHPTRERLERRPRPAAAGARARLGPDGDSRDLAAAPVRGRHRLEPEPKARPLGREAAHPSPGERVGPGGRAGPPHHPGGAVAGGRGAADPGGAHIRPASGRRGA
jgi:DNA invertase Pin-like site-specific DNA recombinase